MPLWLGLASVWVVARPLASGRVWRAAARLVAVLAAWSAALSNGLLVVPARIPNQCAPATTSSTTSSSTNRNRNRSVKVLGVGLSRTGTTTLARALHEVGFAANHAPHRLVSYARNATSPRAWDTRLDVREARAFDAMDDIQVSLVMEELVAAFPDARLVLTTRDPVAWGKSMHAFIHASETLWFAVDAMWHVGLSGGPAHALYQAMYGRDYLSYTPTDWTRVFREHEARVDAFVASLPASKRPPLLRLDVTKGEGWEKLGPFLGLDANAMPRGPLPKADVYFFTMVTQVSWALQDLARWAAFVLNPSAASCD